MIKDLNTRIVCGVLACALAVPAMASSVSVSPGGSTNMSGQIGLGVTSSDGKTTLYKVTCAVNMHANLNPADASFTVDSVSFAPACGVNNGTTSWTVTAGSLPWHGSTTYIGSSGGQVAITGAEIFITQTFGFSPPANYDCHGQFTELYWAGGGAQLQTEIGATLFPFEWDGLNMFGSSGTAPCFANLSLYLSPFQTFTPHP